MPEAPATRVRAQDFYDYHKCPHRVYLNRFGDPRKKLPASDFLNLIFERALLHESQVIKNIAFETPRGATVEEQADSTMKLMAGGAERIYQGVLISGGISGKPDLLERVPGKSTFEDFAYKPVDIKGGSGYDNEAKKTLRVDYGMQLFHYALLLESVQGVLPREGEILNRRKERILYPLPQFEKVYRQTYPEVAALVAGKKTGEPVRCGACPDCQWWGHCEEILVSTNDVSLLPSIGPAKRVALNSLGVRAIKDVIGHDFEVSPVKGIGGKTAEAVKRAARAITEGKMEMFARPNLPDAPLKIYLDFEDDPTQELVYLCGMWVEPQIKGLTYYGLFAEDESREARLWADLQSFCADINDQDYVVFHYSAYEKTKLTQLEKKYGAIEQAALENFKSRMHDLRKIVEEAIVLPERSYSLKKVAPYAGHKYTNEKAGGVQSIVWFHQFQRTPDKPEIVVTLLTYNQEDCQAMKSICDWLRTI